MVNRPGKPGDLRSWVLAVSVYSIVQAKGCSHVRGGVGFFLACAEAFQYVRCEVVVFQILKAALDEFAQVESLGASGL